MTFVSFVVKVLRNTHQHTHIGGGDRLSRMHATLDHMVFQVAMGRHQEIARCWHAVEDAVGQIKSGAVAGTNIPSPPITPTRVVAAIRNLRFVRWTSSVFKTSVPLSGL